MIEILIMYGIFSTMLRKLKLKIALNLEISSRLIFMEIFYLHQERYKTNKRKKEKSASFKDFNKMIETELVYFRSLKRF